MWNCEKCTFCNDSLRQSCDMCYTRKPPYDFTRNDFNSQDDNLFYPGEGQLKKYPTRGKSDWACSQCTFENESHQDTCQMCSLGKRMEQLPANDFDQDRSYQSKVSDETMSTFVTGNFGVKTEIRIVLIGKTGSGKSATGNSLLGMKQFVSKVSGSSITSQCKRGERVRHGKNIIVVDTPGLFDTGMTNENVTKEIVKCIGMTSPGPHAMVLVVGIGRFTKEEQDTVKHFVDHFGEGMLRYMLVLFTRKDDLTKSGESISEYVQSVPNELKTILRQCGNRYIALNNDSTGYDMERQVNEFFGMVDQILTLNGGKCYTNEIYHAAEAALQRRMREEKIQLQEKKNREIQAIERKVAVKYGKHLQEGKQKMADLENELLTQKAAEKKVQEEKNNLKMEMRQKMADLENELRIQKAAEKKVQEEKNNLKMEMKHSIEKKTTRLQ